MPTCFFWIFALVAAIGFGAVRAEAQTYCQDYYSGAWYLCDYGVTHNNGPTWANGLPQYVDDETIYYLYDPLNDKYQVGNGTAIPRDHLFLRFKFALKRWVWSSADDWRPIAPNSKLQGKRIGYPEGNTLSLDWYRLSDDWLTWKRVTDRERPIVYRWDEGAIVEGQIYPADWAQLGGTLDPVPTGKPTCKITLGAQTVKARQPLSVHIAIEGQADDVEIEGQHPTISRPPKGQTYADYTLIPEAPGFYTATAKVKGPGGESTCEAPYGVDPADTFGSALACQLTLDRSAAKTGESVVATLTSRGGKVTAVEIAGAEIFDFLNRTDGSVNVQRRVELRRQDVDWETGKIEIKGVVYGDKNASASCTASVSVP